jgi:hypothetical protein
MRRVLAEFAPARRLPSAVWWSLSAALLLSVGSFWWVSQKLVRAELELMRAQEAIRSSKERLSNEMHATFASARAPQTFDASAKVWDAERRAPLAEALRLLERVQVDGAVVRSLELDAQRTQFRLIIEATNHETVVRFGRALNEGVEIETAGALWWRLVQSEAPVGAAGVRARFDGGTR